MIEFKQAALRVLAEQRASRSLKAETFRKRFGTKLTKALAAEVEQLETEVKALDAVIAAVENDTVPF